MTVVLLTRSPMLGIIQDTIFDSECLNGSRGHVRISIKLKNTTSVPAENPFFCMPARGLDVMPHEGWLSNEFQSVNRMIRFTQRQPTRLTGGDEVNCCVLRLPYRQLGGNVVSYGWGGRRQISALPDLRLFCVTGAGNFPAERFSVVIPASSITGAITSYASPSPFRYRNQRAVAPAYQRRP